MNLDRRLVNLLREGLAPFSFCVAAGAIAGVAAILQAKWLSRVIAEVFLLGSDLPGVLLPLLWGLLAIILRSLAIYASEAMGAVTSRAVKSNLRQQLVVKLFRLGPIFTRQHASGDLTTVFMQGVDTLDAYFSQYLPQVILAGAVPLAVLVFVFPLDWVSGVILLLTGPLIPLFMFLIGSSAERLTRRQFKALRQMSAYLLDTLQGLRALKELGRSAQHVSRVQAVSDRYRTTTLQVLRVTFLSALALELLGTLSTALIAVQVGLRLLYGQMGFEQGFFVLLIAPEFYQPLRTLGLRFHAAMNGVNAAQQIFSILSEPETGSLAVADRLPAPKIFFDRGLPPIRFEAVSYHYPHRSAPALVDASFELQPGLLTALVGESGSGKTTVANLILRFASPLSGAIRVGDRDLAEIPLEDWYANLVWVPQNPYLINGSIADNLRIANKNASQSDLRAACDQVHLMEWIDTLDQGLNTPIGEGGARISGGQAQRLALARALIRAPALLVMDEPTARLDPPEEKLIASSIKTVLRNQTVLVIAHRLTTISQADTIVVLDRGRVAEVGRHSTLINQGGQYTRLVSAWSGRS